MLDKPPKNPPAKTDPALLARFAAIVGDKYAITDPAAQAPYLVEMRGLFSGHTPLVLRPGAVAEVSAILKLANETRTADRAAGRQYRPRRRPDSAPQRNRALAQPARPHPRGRCRPRTPSPARPASPCSARAKPQPQADRLYPQLLPSEGTCTIGGNLSTNAGGTAALAYGIARSHALGLEVVLADGRVLNNLNKLKKDNTGYDLKNLFIGAEGTLGIITAAVLRLVPRPRSVETAFAGITSAEAALELLGIAQERSGGDVTSFELMTRAGIELVLRQCFGRAAIRSPRRIPGMC